MPATSLEKASRLQLKELEAINKDRKSSILSSMHMLGSSKRRMEEKCSLQVGAKQEGGRADPCAPAGSSAVGQPWCCRLWGAGLRLVLHHCSRSSTATPGAPAMAQPLCLQSFSKRASSPQNWAGCELLCSLENWQEGANLGQ